MLDTTRSEEAFRIACRVIPGGVDSPVRAARAVGRNPVFLARGEGSHVWDVDGNGYVDYVGSWGPLICGHAHPAVVEALCRAAQQGSSFGAPTEAETALAEEIRRAYDAVEMVRFVNSGTEATMSALRLARGATGRDYIVKFEGCYHGHSDGLLVKAGSGALTNGRPSSAGVPKDVAEKTLVARYNDSESVAALFEEYRERIAAVIVEPVAGNMGVVPPDPGFLLDLRALTLEQGTVLIFDEVMTGFRVDYGGASRYYGVLPDLVCLGKVIGGGLPLAAFGGRADLMQGLAPLGPVYQAGTLSGNPLAVAGGLATFGRYRQAPPYQSRRRPCGRPGGHRARLRRAASGQPRGGYVLGLLHGRAGGRLRERLQRRCRQVRPLLPGHAGGGGLLGPEPVRGGVRLDGPQRAGHRVHAGAGRARLARPIAHHAVRACSSKTSSQRKGGDWYVYGFS